MLFRPNKVLEYHGYPNVDNREMEVKILLLFYDLH